MGTSIRYAICNEIFVGRKVTDVFRLAAEVGYDAVELAPYTLAPSITELTADRRVSIAAEARSAGVAIAGLHWLLVGPVGLHVSSADREVRSRTVVYLRELIRACADLGGSVLVFGSPKQRSIGLLADRDAAIGRAIETFAACARAAREAGVTLCLEPLPTAETDFINTVAEAVELVRVIGEPALRMMLDVKSMCAEIASGLASASTSASLGLPELIRLGAPYCAHFHANDANRGGPGFGAVDFVPIFRCLAEVGYAGYVSVEAFEYQTGAESVARESLAYLRGCAALAEAPER